MIYIISNIHYLYYIYYKQVTQLTQAVNAFVVAMALNQANPPACVPPAPVPAHVAPIDFQWRRLVQPCPTSFPPATLDQVKQIALGLQTKLSLLIGRDHHEVEFVLSMLSDYEEFEPDLQNIVYQRANMLSIAVHYGWGTAIAASNTAAPTAVVLPPGFQPEQHRRENYGGGRYGGRQQPRQQQQQPAAQPAQQQQQQGGGNQYRGRGGGRRDRRRNN